jgi:uncharacterized membrane protein YraQ (UPF0718 family)
LAISIPFAVALRVSGLADRLKGAFGRRPIVGILLATAAGAFGPFCSCSVIPVIASMLIGGVPLAPVMSFWIASPTMDPEIFVMSAALLGWPLAVARLVATLLLSLAAGFITYGVVKRGWIGEDFLRAGATASTGSVSPLVRLRSLARRLVSKPDRQTALIPMPGTEPESCGCSVSSASEPSISAAASSGRWSARLRRIAEEGLSTALWVSQFMLLAFVLEALIKLYVPQELIVRWIGTGNPWAPALAALVGIPLYTGNLTALPLIGGLLEGGMNPAAALAFLIAGPVTTIPAMAAVWGVVRNRVFLLYLGLGIGGALTLGYAYYAALAVLPGVSG